MSTYETNAPLLEIRGLTKEFRQGKDRVVAVHEIDLDIQKGEVFGLVAAASPPSAICWCTCWSPLPVPSA